MWVHAQQSRIAQASPPCSGRRPRPAHIFRAKLVDAAKEARPKPETPCIRSGNKQTKACTKAHDPRSPHLRSRSSEPARARHPGGTGTVARQHETRAGNWRTSGTPTSPWPACFRPRACPSGNVWNLKFPRKTWPARSSKERPTFPSTTDAASRLAFDRGDTSGLKQEILAALDDAKQISGLGRAHQKERPYHADQRPHRGRKGTEP